MRFKRTYFFAEAVGLEVGLSLFRVKIFQRKAIYLTFVTVKSPITCNVFNEIAE